MKDATGPNADQIEYWNQVAGPKWVALASMIEEQIDDLGRAGMKRANPASGERVLDVGCGCGQTTLQLAERVGPRGRVVGMDISGPMLARARERAAGLDRAEFRNADAQTHDFSGERFDLAFSRFGVMFFADPIRAFANLGNALAPGGRLTFLCWQELPKNPWMMVPVLAAAKHLPLPPPPAPGAPGPFSLADADRLREILDGAFEAIEIEPLESELRVGGRGGLDRAVEFVTQMGPAAAALREAEASVRARVLDEIREAYAPFATADGVVLSCAAWIVSGRARA